jgi:hypothetical protein
MEIDKKQLCRHELLPSICPTCQIIAFLSCKILRKDVVRAKIFQMLKEMQKSWVLNIRCGSYEETRYEPDEYSEYGGFVFGTHDDIPLKPNWPCYKIIFAGSFDSLMGFINCFIFQYMQHKWFEYDENIGCEHEEIQKELDKHMLYDKFAEKCPFGNSPERDFVAVYGHDTDNYWHSFKNLEEYVAGHLEMCSIEFPEVTFDELELSHIVKKEQEHVEDECLQCSGSGIVSRPDGDIMYDFDDLETENLCTAYYCKV